MSLSLLYKVRLVEKIKSRASHHTPQAWVPKMSPIMSGHYTPGVPSDLAAALAATAAAAISAPRQLCSHLSSLLKPTSQCCGNFSLSFLAEVFLA